MSEKLASTDHDAAQREVASPSAPGLTQQVRPQLRWWIPVYGVYLIIATLIGMRSAHWTRGPSYSISIPEKTSVVTSNEQEGWIGFVMVDEKSGRLVWNRRRVNDGSSVGLPLKLEVDSKSYLLGLVRDRRLLIEERGSALSWYIEMSTDRKIDLTEAVKFPINWVPQNNSFGIDPERSEGGDNRLWLYKERHYRIADNHWFEVRPGHSKFDDFMNAILRPFGLAKEVESSVIYVTRLEANTDQPICQLVLSDLPTNVSDQGNYLFQIDKKSQTLIVYRTHQIMPMVLFQLMVGSLTFIGLVTITLCLNWLKRTRVRASPRDRART